jgi:hypothetical protein
VCIYLLYFIGANVSHELAMTSYLSTRLRPLGDLEFIPPMTYIELQFEDGTAVKNARGVFIL